VLTSAKAHSPNANQVERKAPKTGWSRDPIVWATIVIAIATVVSVAVGIAQWCALTRTDKSIAKQAEAALSAERPILAYEMSLSRLTDPEDQSPANIPDGDVPKYLAVEIKFSDLNPVPAILNSIQLKWDVWGSANMPPSPPSFASAATYEIGAGNYLSNRRPLAVQPDNFVIELTDEQQKSIRENKADLFDGILNFDNFVDENSIGGHPYKFAQKYVFVKKSPRGRTGFVHDEHLTGDWTEEH
jgi:hypothetical protein